MEINIDEINDFIKNQTFEFDFDTSYGNSVKSEYKFKIDKVKPLISIGEWTDHIFVSVKVTNGEGMMNLYISLYGDKEIVGREKVANMWFSLSKQISMDIEEFLKFFGVNMSVVVDNLKFEPSENFVPLVDLP
jgi:hypothetical protein